MKIRILSIIAFFVIGVFAIFTVYKSQNQTQVDYENYINLARENAENDIPYVSMEYYKKAFAIKNDNEDLYCEYLEQTKKFDEKTYLTALSEYKSNFPNSEYGYEHLAQKYFDDEQYKNVLEIYNSAKENNVTSEKLEELYNNSIYKYTVFKGNYQNALPFVGNLALVQKNNKWGYLTSSGSYMIDTQFDEAQMFISDTTAVKTDGEWYLINKKGIKVDVPSEKVEYLSFVNEGLAVVKKDGKYGYASQEYKIPEKCEWDYATNFKSGVAAVKKDKKWGLINSKLESITEMKYDDIKIDEMSSCISNGVIFAKENNKYIMLNSSGERIGDLSFDDADMFKGTNPAAVKIDGKWGFVFADGKIAVEPKYEYEVKSYNLRLAPFCKNGKWGYMNEKGETTIEPKFDECTSFTDNGIAVVKENGFYSYIKLVVYN